MAGTTHSSATLHCTVMTPEGLVFDGPADLVVAPGSDGELGILPRHAPLIAALGAGALRVRQGTIMRHWLVMGGFLEVLHNKVIVLAHRLETPESIDPTGAERMLEAARADGRAGGTPAAEAGVVTPLVAARARARYARRYLARR